MYYRNWAKYSGSTLNKIISSFWAKWMEVVKPALIMERKWNADIRNLCVGDVVLVLENDSKSNTYKLARVTEATPDKDGKVRSVKVTYKSYTCKSGSTTYSVSSDITISRSVQRLCLIVPIEEPRTHHNDY